MSSVRRLLTSATELPESSSEITPLSIRLPIGVVLVFETATERKNQVINGSVKYYSLHNYHA